MVQASTRPGDWCLDFFAGSGTLGAVAARARAPLRADRLQPRGRRGHARAPRGAAGAATRAGVRIDSAGDADYHIELRQFPRNFCRFNLTGPEIGAIALTWAQEQMLELGDQKWSPAPGDDHRSSKGPQIPIERLSMGRGWPTAQREGEDVTERVLAEARQAIAQGAGPRRPQRRRRPRPRASRPRRRRRPAGARVELAACSAPSAGRLLAAWRAAAAAARALLPARAWRWPNGSSPHGSGPAAMTRR